MFIKLKLFVALLILFVPKVEAHNPQNNLSYTTSFSLVSNLIVVKASMFNLEGNFIIDTGVEDLIINDKNSSGREENTTFRSFSNTEIKCSSQYGHFVLGPLKLNSVLALSADLDHISQHLQMPIQGLIGTKILRQFELIIDYKSTQITFIKLDKKGNPLSPVKTFDLLDTIPIVLKNGLPFIYASNLTNKLCLLLDTGASINLLSDRMGNQISIKPMVIKANLSDLSMVTKKAKQKLFKYQMQIGKSKTLPMNTLIQNLNHLNRQFFGQNIDGVIGFPFLLQQKTSINIRKKEIYLWPKKEITGGYDCDFPHKIETLLYERQNMTNRGFRNSKNNYGAQMFSPHAQDVVMQYIPTEDITVDILITNLKRTGSQSAAARGVFLLEGDDPIANICIAHDYDKYAPTKKALAIRKAVLNANEPYFIIFDAEGEYTFDIAIQKSSE